MPCLICNCKDLTFSNIYNCKVCDNCGYIMMGIIFDNPMMFTPSKTKDHYLNGNLEAYERTEVSLNMLGSQFSIDQKLLDKTYIKFKSCLMHGLFKGYTDDERAVAALYITMQENNNKVIIRNYCKFMDVDYNRCLRLAKSISKVIIITDYKAYIRSTDILTELILEDLVFGVIKKLEDKHITITKNIIAAVIYNELKLNSYEITQAKVCEVFGLSISALNNMLNKIKEELK